MVNEEDDRRPVISGDEARAGLHEHRVHYVLAFGLAGGIVAFLVVGLYFGYGKLSKATSQLSLPSDPTTLLSFAILIALAAVGTVILIGLWNVLSGRSLNTSQLVMRWRVVLQFIALCLVMAALYLSGKS
jgi:hypothetical protein